MKKDIIFLIMKLLTIIWASLFSSLFIYPNVIVPDTLYSDYNLDGGIVYQYELNNYLIFFGTDNAGGAGDGYNPLLWNWQYTKGYFTFPIDEIPYDSAGFDLISATFQLFQYISTGNNELGVYPIWDFPGGDTNYCYLDHVVYGNTLDVSDWTAGDIDDEQTLYPLYTTVTTSPDTGFRNIDVTDLVLNDIINLRENSQFRIHFPIGTDYDPWPDGVGFSGLSYPLIHRRPKLIIEYQNLSIDDYNNQNSEPELFFIENTYPNPFNSNITIKYQINKSDDYKLIVYDIKGRLLDILISDFHSKGHYMIQWNGKSLSGTSAPSGLYLIKLIGKDRSKTFKINLLK